MQNKISISIVTFKQRFELVSNLIHNIRKFNGDEIDINLAINGNNEELMSDEYRKNILSLCMSYKNIYPIFCSEFKSLSKLWNTLVIWSRTPYTFIICDDVEYTSDKVLSTVNQYINETKNEFFTINYQFSHFVLTKQILHTLGYFDERLCAFGEEDGDIVYRYIETFNHKIPNINIDNIVNKGRYDLKNKNFETHIDNKPKFNREFMLIKYTSNKNGICGMNSFPVTKTIEDYQQYPYEMFVLKNKHNFKKYTSIINEL